MRDFLHENVLGDEDNALARYLKPDLFIIDDMGMKNLPRRSGEVLFEIIMRRYETRSTVMTSNRPLEDWGKLIGDVPSATAILDRFLHHAEVLAFNGRSYRLRKQAGDTKLAPTGENAADSRRRRRIPIPNLRRQRAVLAGKIRTTPTPPLAAPNDWDDDSKNRGRF